MLIDWFTIIAQVINFLVLVWLMKRFLFKPILKAIDAREKRIAQALADADLKKAEALQEKMLFRDKNNQFSQQQQQLLDTATKEANALRQRLLLDARQAADDFSAKRQEAWQREQQSMTEELIRQTREEVFAISRKTLTDLADMSLEKRMVDVFRYHLLNLSKEKKATLTASLQTSPSPVLVRSAFELQPEQQQEIQHSLSETLPAGFNVSFETEPELISGIELTTNGQKLAWSIHEYLTSLEKRVSNVLLEQGNQKNTPVEENLKITTPGSGPNTQLAFAKERK